MTWLERLDDRQLRRLGRSLQHNAMQSRDAAQHRWQRFSEVAAPIASQAVQQVVDYGRHEGAAIGRTVLGEARQAARSLADYHHDERDKIARTAITEAGRAARQVADYTQVEGAMLARNAVVEARRAARAFRSDPLPAVVAVVGVAMVARLFLSRTRTRTRR